MLPSSRSSAPEHERAQAFYSELFGWAVDADPAMGGYGLVDTKAGEAALTWDHGRRNMMLMNENVMPIMCPARHHPSIHGFCLIVGGREAAADVMQADPAVQAGIFAYFLHPCIGFPRSTLP